MVLLVLKPGFPRHGVLAQVYIVMVNKSFLRVLVEEEATDGWPLWEKTQSEMGNISVARVSRYLPLTGRH